MKELEFEDWRLTLFWIALAVVAAIAGFVFGWSWRDRSGALASVSLLNVMTALGTVGAVIAAVFLGGSEQRRREQDRKNIAAVMAHLFAADLLEIRGACTEIVSVADQIANADGAFVAPGARVFLNQLAQLLGAPAINQHIMHLNCFSGSTPATLAEMMGNLPRLQRAVQMIALDEKRIDDALRKFALSISRDAKNILRLITAATAAPGDAASARV